MNNLRNFSSKAQRAIEKHYSNEEVTGYMAVFVLEGVPNHCGYVAHEVITDNRVTKSRFEEYIRDYGKRYEPKLLKIFDLGFHDKIIDKDSYYEHYDKIKEKYPNIPIEKEEIPGDKIE